MRPNRFSKLWPNHQSWTFRSWPTSKQHDSPTGVGKRCFQQPHGYAQGHTSTSQRTPIIGNWPGILLKLFKDVRQLELALLNRQKESRRWRHMRRRTTGSHGLLLWAETGSKEPEHLLDLFCRVVFVPAEDIGFGTFGVAKLVDVSLVSVSITEFSQCLPN